MNRIIYFASNKVSDSNKMKENNIGDKMTKIKYRILVVQSQLHTNDEILKIYDNTKNDDEISRTINKLYEKDENNIQLMILKDKIEEYLSNKAVKEKLEKLQILEEQISKDKADKYFFTKKLFYLEEENEKRKKEIAN